MLQTANPTTPEAADAAFWAVCRAAISPPEELNAAEWAEKHRELTPRQTSRPGPWRNENQPGLVGLMVLCTRPGIRELWVKKSAQFGASEGGRCVIARAAHLDPVPVMLVLADEKSGRKIVRKRIIPLFEDTPVLRNLLTGSTRDKKLTSITLSNGFELSLAWAGSPAAMASDPYCVVWLDEVDKYQGNSKQADPVGEARVRLRTYVEQGRSLLLAMSTPSTPDGPIARGHSDCEIKLWFFAPCPHCGIPQRIAFDRLKWEKFDDLPDAKSRAARVRARKAAWIECANVDCGERIDDRHKRSIYKAGFWGTADEGWRIYFDGHEEGEKPEGATVGMHIHGLIDLAVPFYEVAAEFIKCDGRPAELKDFYNLTLGEEFKDPQAVKTVSMFRAMCVPNEETGFVPARQQVVPKWASRLLLTVDTQKEHFWFVLRAWGYGLRSQRIHHGIARSFEELEDLFYHRRWPYEDSVYPPLQTCRIGIDSGGGIDAENRDATRTEEVYQWCNRDPLFRLALKGSSRPLEAPGVRSRKRLYTPANRARSPIEVYLNLIDGTYFRDLLSSMIGNANEEHRPTVQVPDPETGEVSNVAQWNLNDFNDDEHYNRHMANVIKTRLKKGRGFEDRYTTKHGGDRKDLHDCEAYQLAMAIGMQFCVALAPPQIMAKQQAAAQSMVSPVSGGVRMPDGRKFGAWQR